MAGRTTLENVRNPGNGVPYPSVPKAHTWLSDGTLGSGVPDCGRKQAGRMYFAVVRNAIMEIPVNKLRMVQTMTQDGADKPKQGGRWRSAAMGIASAAGSLVF